MARTRMHGVLAAAVAVAGSLAGGRRLGGTAGIRFTWSSMWRWMLRWTALIVWVSIIGAATPACAQDRGQKSSIDAPRVALKKGDSLWFTDEFTTEFRTTVDGVSDRFKLTWIALEEWTCVGVKDSCEYRVRVRISRVWAAGIGPTFLVLDGDSTDSARRIGEVDVDFEARLLATGAAGGVIELSVSGGGDVARVDGVPALVKAAQARVKVLNPGLLALCGPQEEAVERRRMSILFGAGMPSELEQGQRWATRTSAIREVLFAFDESSTLNAIRPDAVDIGSVGEYEASDPDAAPSGTTKSSMKLSRTGRRTLSRSDGLPLEAVSTEVTKRVGASATCSMEQSGFAAWTLRRISESEARRISKAGWKLDDPRNGR